LFVFLDWFLKYFVSEINFKVDNRSILTTIYHNIHRHKKHIIAKSVSRYTQCSTQNLKCFYLEHAIETLASIYVDKHETLWFVTLCKHEIFTLITLLHTIVYYIMMDIEVQYFIRSIKIANTGDWYNGF
jgi:hypothetical protein